MRCCPALLVAPILLSVALMPRLALAQNAQNKAAAESLFEQARRLLKEGQNAEACPKLEESQRLDPGVGTLLHLGECYERLGRTASAWATFHEASALAQTSQQSERVKLAQQRAESLETRLIWLRIEVPPEARVPGLEVRQNGQLIPPQRWGVEVPVDPGVYEITASAPGYQEFHMRLPLQEPGHQPFTLGGLSPLPPPLASSAPAPLPPLAPSHPPASPPPPAPREAPPATRRYAAVSLGVLGLAFAGVGTYFGVHALSRNKDASPYCDAQNRCDEPGLRARHDAVQSGNLSTLFFGVGLLSAGTGLTLWLTEPTPAPTTLSLSPSGAHLRGFF